MSVAAPGFVMWNTIVVLFGVWMPESGPPLYLGLVEPASGAGEAAPKYAGQYALPTLGLPPRSSANATSWAVTARLTGAL